MILNDDILRRETIQLIRQIDLQIEDVRARAKDLGVVPELMRDGNNNYIMAPMLVAKTQAYSALVMLQS